MTNTELVSVIIDMLREYFTFFMPIYGLLAGVNIVIKWIYSFTFRPFNKLDG